MSENLKGLKTRRWVGLAFLILTLLAYGRAWASESVEGSWYGSCKQTFKVTAKGTNIESEQNFDGTFFLFKPNKVFIATNAYKGEIARGKWEQKGTKVSVFVRTSLVKELKELLNEAQKKGAVSQVQYSQTGGLQNGRLKISVTMKGKVTLSPASAVKGSFVVTQVIQGIRTTEAPDLPEEGEDTQSMPE